MKQPLAFIHKWLGLVVGLQLLIWILTGIYFNWVDHRIAKGNELRQSSSHTVKPFPIDIIDLDEKHFIGVKRVELTHLAETPVYQLYYSLPAHNNQKQDVKTFHAETGLPFSLTQNTVKNIASNSYSAEAEISDIELMYPPHTDLAGEENPLWRVVVNDSAQTHIYVSPITGKVIAHVNNARRLHNIMFMLHFMDYAKTGGFNHTLITVFAVLNLIFVGSGVLWLIKKLPMMVHAVFSSGKKPIELLQNNGSSGVHALVPKGEVILHSLRNVNIHLPSICGGGGVCGSCKFQTPDTLPVTEADKAHCSPQELAHGIRLACQHSIDAISKISVP
ncbi:PepSY domain-containing protein [Aestuariibacter sp. AA17]|uniref:PepSY domain-containing protein n=1 Tax=Fluctibacter corallii TaxID=2984329 RepID=A0ABT3A412_9ALTE|nr:PepSY domain-containing protein [Aestuariibacter sp. AA17]MCV2883388.1 PepSY domain-containing protein [Aestuariibacter sp. AA17]